MNVRNPFQEEGAMADTTIPFQIVLLTQDYSISGGLFLREQRLSDFLNDKRDSTILLRNTIVASLEEPARTLEKTPFSIVPKSGIVLAFEPPQRTAPLVRKLMKYPKQKYDVFLALDSMQVHGKLNVQGPLDLRQAITNMAESFIPITEATVTLNANPAFSLKREAVLVNVQRIRFIGEVPQPAPDEATPRAPAEETPKEQ
jgi:hypothetical protein